MSIPAFTLAWAFLCMSPAEVAQTIREHPRAKAVLVNHPTYYGVCSNLKEITRLAHEAG